MNSRYLRKVSKTKELFFIFLKKTILAKFGFKKFFDKDSTINFSKKRKTEEKKNLDKLTKKFLKKKSRKKPNLVITKKPLLKKKLLSIKKLLA